MTEKWMSNLNKQKKISNNISHVPTVYYNISTKVLSGYMKYFISQALKNFNLIHHYDGYKRLQYLLLVKKHFNQFGSKKRLA